MRLKTIARIVLTVCMARAVYGNETPRRLTVCVRVEAAEPRPVRPLAQRLAAGMFADIGISVQWKPWERACDSSPVPIVIELASATPEEVRPGSLAYALPYQGKNITIFLDRVEHMQSPAIVLAHVMVHEIVHVVQGVCRHSATGMMKAHWTSNDLVEMRHRTLPFAPEDLILLDLGLAARRTGD